MNRLDRLIIRELLGPWIFGVFIFTGLIFASVLLVRITDWVVKGVPADVVLNLIFLLLPGMVVKTFSMALLLATLLAFGRLSNDSEIVAIRAAGASLFRVMRPVMVLGLGIAMLAFSINEFVVPGFSYRASEVQQNIRQELDTNKIGTKIFEVIYDKGKAVGYVGALDLDVVEGILRDAVVVTFDRTGRPAYVMFAKELRYEPPRDWRIKGGARVLAIYGDDVLDIKDEAWPAYVARPTQSPKNLFAGLADDMDAFSIGQIAEGIAALRRDPTADPRKVANLEFGYFNKFALPLTVVVFALLGAPLGIRSHRAGVASGFALSIALSFAYLIIANFMAVYSRAGKIPPYAASFAPVAIGLFAACVLIYRKNR